MKNNFAIEYVMQLKVSAYKKIILLCAILLVCTVNTYAVGIGAQFGIKDDDNIKAGASLLFWAAHESGLGIDWIIEEETTIIGATLDVIPIWFDIIDLDLFTLWLGAGPGLFGIFRIPKDASKAFNYDAGLRIPVMLVADFNRITIFLQVAPAFSFNFENGFNYTGMRGTGVSVGFLYWTNGFYR
jgi:hypothetical protein